MALAFASWTFLCSWVSFYNYNIQCAILAQSCDNYYYPVFNMYCCNALAKSINTTALYNSHSFVRMVLFDEHSTTSTSRSWRYRAITVSVAVVGPPSEQFKVRDALVGATSDLDGLILGNDDGLGDRRLERMS